MSGLRSVRCRSAIAKTMPGESPAVKSLTVADKWHDPGPVHVSPAARAGPPRAVRAQPAAWRAGCQRHAPRVRGVSDSLPPSVRRRLSFEVAESGQIAPSMQRILLTAPELAGFSYDPGQDVMLLVAADGTKPIRRRYTIRSLDRPALALTFHIVRHAGGPGERWVSGARAGDKIEGIGPRGKITTSPAADWHLFMGDESAMPAILAMTESLPGDADATLVIEVPGPDDEQELLAPARTRLSWLHRLS